MVKTIEQTAQERIDAWNAQHAGEAVQAYIAARQELRERRARVDQKTNRSLEELARSQEWRRRQ